VDSGGLLLAVLVTVAGIQDRDAGLRLLALVRTRHHVPGVPAAGSSGSITAHCASVIDSEG
jgi:hypothetical protein